LLSHILAVSSIWLSRAKGENETAKRFDLYTFEECEAVNNGMHSNWIDYIRSLVDVEKIMKFKLLGQQSQMTVLDCINHVVVHGSYHRGQIVALLKGQLPELPTTDLCFLHGANPDRKIMLSCERKVYHHPNRASFRELLWQKTSSS